MGRARCEKHGYQGMSASYCRHVDAALEQGAVGELNLVEFEVDVADDGTLLLEYVFCESCAASIGVTAGGVVSGERVESKDFPWNTARCAACFADWKNARG
jgi:hypothetical protein